MPKRFGTRLKKNSFSKPQLLLFVLIFAAIGSYILIRSFAASNPNLAGDLNNDNTVNAIDLSMLLSNYTTSNAAGDANSDGTVNAIDLSIVLSHYGQTYAGPTCVLNDNSACPASYFNGPLGANNLIPSKPGQFLLDQYGAVPCAWQTCGKSGIIKRQTDIGKHFDGIGMQKNYGGKADNCTLRSAGNPDQADMEQWIHDNGSFPIIRWNPDGTIGDVNNGLYDQCFTNMANYWKSFNFTIMLSPFTEFDGHAGSWQAPASSANGNINYCGAPFITAWQRMVNKIHPIAPNVGFTWEPQEGETRSCIDISYPGDTYVDWAGTDWYNFCSVGGPNYCSPLHPGWAEFSELFNYTALGSSAKAQHDAWGPHKPFYVIETGTGYDSNYPTKKGQWFRNVPAAVKPMKYLRGIMWFDEDVSSVEAPSEGMPHNFRVDYPTSNPDVYAGYIQMSQDPWFAAK
jgi:hypothetical protein